LPDYLKPQMDAIGEPTAIKRTLDLRGAAGSPGTGVDRFIGSADRSKLMGLSGRFAVGPTQISP